ncbi:hypothetical protein PR048_010353 [Dryococelus australis]|uniref:Uncharacterized protein n=1 Tax=Dryococelus australis TaxID=614101 RepID=A0ABQ9I3K6_9NEOP|nr:hypothetical protein PR048_010353 [Dryococelus australis]
MRAPLRALLHDKNFRQNGNSVGSEEKLRVGACPRQEFSPSAVPAELPVRAGRQAARRVHVHTCGDMCACPRAGKLTVSGQIARAECGTLFIVKMSAEFIIDCDILITLVQERPIVWDKTTEEYKDRRLTLEA